MVTRWSDGLYNAPIIVITRVGWGDTGDLTNSSVKFPIIGAKKLVKPHYVPNSKEGFPWDLIYLSIKCFLVQQTAAVESPRM